MAPTLKIDTSNINAIFRQIARYSGATLERVIEFETGKVIEGAIRGTPAASVAKIRAAQDAQRFGVFDAGNGRKKYCLANRYPNTVWAKISAARKASLQRKLHARGLAKRSWKDLADAYGLAITTPSFVARAIARTGKRYDNATARKVRTGRAFGIYFENRQPTVQIVGGRRALQRALSGRTRYFQKNLEKGVFFDLKKIGRAYPGMIVT